MEKIQPMEYLNSENIKKKFENYAKRKRQANEKQEALMNENIIIDDG